MTALKSASVNDVIVELAKLGLTQSYIKESLIAVLYHEGKITSKKACQLLGVERREFEDGILQNHGYTTYGNHVDDAAIEIDALHA